MSSSILTFYTVLFEYSNNDIETLKFNAKLLDHKHRQVAFYAKKIAVVYADRSLSVDIFCVNTTAIYTMLARLMGPKFSSLNQDELLTQEMKLEEKIGLMISRVIEVKENAKFICYGDTHADNMLMNIGIQLYYRTKLMTVHLGDVLKPREDKWFQNIESEKLITVRNRRALEMMNNCLQFSAINDVKGPFIVLKGNHDKTNKISNVCLIATTPHLQLVFQHAFLPKEHELSIKPRARFQLYNDEYKDFEFTLLCTNKERIGFFHACERKEKFNQPPENKHDIEDRLVRWIRMTMRPDYEYNPFLFYGHELNAFNLSVNIDNTLTLPMKDVKLRIQNDLNDIVHLQNKSLFHRIIPLDGKDGCSVRIHRSETK